MYSSISAGALRGRDVGSVAGGTRTGDGRASVPRSQRGHSATDSRERTSRPITRSVMVMLGEPDPTVVSGLQSIGFTQIADGGDVTVWSQPIGPPTPAPSPQPIDSQERAQSSLLMTIAEASQVLGIGRSTVYEMIGRGVLEVVHVGRSARVPTQALFELVERLRADQCPKGSPRAVG